MKLSEARACDNCGGETFPEFFIIRASVARFSKPHLDAIYMALQAMTDAPEGSVLNPLKLQVVEALSPDADKVITVAMDQVPDRMISLAACMACVNSGRLNIEKMVERFHAWEETTQMALAAARALEAAE